MDSEQVSATTLDPAHRVLRRCTIEDAEGATEMSELCIGTDVAAQREYISLHSGDLDQELIDA